MLKYVSFKPGDDTPQFVCPRCLKPFSAVSPPHNMPCGHIECDNCRKRRSQRNETDTPCCKQASSGYSNYFPSTNHPLSDLANQLNSSSRSFFDGKVMCEECDGRHAEDDLLSCANCKKSHVRYSCLMDRHNSHGWSKGGIHADYHNHHMTPDHTLLPDRRVLNVSGHNFIVSASLLAMNSPFFDNLFFGSSIACATSTFNVDAEPKVFGDLLDMIYPWKHGKRIYDSAYD